MFLRGRRGIAVLLCTWIAVGLCAGLAPPQERSRREYKERLVELCKELEAERPESRRGAVRALADLGGEDAWKAVFAALGDADASVGDAAQLSLSRLRDPELVLELCGRSGLESRAPRVAVRAAEAVGRLPIEVDGELLARRLSTKEPAVSRLLLRSIELQHEGRRLGGPIERVWAGVLALSRSSHDAELSARALVTLAALEHPQALELARKAALSSEGVERAAALVALRRAAPGELLGVARARAADGEPAVRLLAIAALRSLRSRPALEVLVERLETEPRLGLRMGLIEALQGATGFQYRADPRPWRQLMERVPLDWDGTPLRAAPAPAAADAAQRTVAAAPLRLPVDSDRVSFLFDFSGSMWTALPDGRTPKQIVEVRLREALEGLSEETEFNLVPYSYDPLPWQAQLVAAKPRAVREALEFFEACNARGKGNVYDAALLALSDPRVDRIVILTDGVPTGGTHSDLDLVIPLLEEHNLLRGVSFDLVLVDAPGPKVRRWRAFAERSGGRAVEVAME